MIKEDWECTIPEKVGRASRLCVLLLDSIARDIYTRSERGEIGAAWGNSCDVLAVSIKRKITMFKEELLKLEKQVKQV